MNAGDSQIMKKFLDEMEATGAAELANGPHLVKVNDPEAGHDTYHGPFANAAAALEAAERIAADLNKGIGEDTPWVATVHPLEPGTQ